VGEIEWELLFPGDATVCLITPLRGMVRRHVRSGMDQRHRGGRGAGCLRILRNERLEAQYRERRLPPTPVPGETDIGLFEVFDRYGGAACLQYLADRLFAKWQGMDEWLLEECSTNVLRRSLKFACEKLEEAMRFAPGPAYTFCGSTGVIGLLIPSDVVVTNVGDLRAVLVTRNAAGLLAAVLMSVDHTPELTKERKRIEGAGMSVEKIVATDGTVHWKVFRDWLASKGC